MWDEREKRPKSGKAGASHHEHFFLVGTVTHIRAKAFSSALRFVRKYFTMSSTSHWVWIYNRKRVETDNSIGGFMRFCVPAASGR